MRILIVGGMGVIGGAITKAAAKKKYDVFVVSRRELSTEWVSLGVNGVSGNWRDDEFATAVVREGYDVVVDTQVFDEKQLMRSMRLANGHCTQYIYISTDSVYAHPAIDLRECAPIDMHDIYWDYGIKKRKAELYLQNHGTEYSFSWTVIRPTITFGNTRIPVGYASKRSTYTLAERIIQGKPIIRFDDPQTRHAVCHTSIFGEATVGLLLNEKSYGEFYHISDDYAYSYDEIFASIEKFLGKQGTYVYVPADSVKKYSRSLYQELMYDKNPDFVLDNSKIKEIVPDVNYHMDLDDIMSNILSNLRDNNIGEDEEYNYITDNILTEISMEINESDLKNKVNEYIHSLSMDYKQELAEFKKKKKIDNLLFPLKQCKRKIKMIFVDISENIKSKGGI